MPPGDTRRTQQTVIDRFVNPAIRNGQNEIEVLVREVRHLMGNNVDSTLIAEAMNSQSFLTANNLAVMERLGEGKGYRGVRYRILGQSSDAPNFVPGVITPLLESEPKEDISVSWREKVIELSPSEFQELAREYLQAKGFADAEIEIVIRMKM